MAHEIAFDDTLGIVEIKYAGEISLEEILSAIENIWEMMQLHQTQNVLTDLLNAELKFDLSRILEINQKIADLGVSKTTRSAVVVPPEDATHRNIQVHLYEFASGTDGWLAQMFYSREQAVDWLLMKK